jgi:hypothetical protein
MKWKIDQDTKWPFDIYVRDEENNVVARFDIASSTAHKTISDAMSAKGYDKSDKELTVAWNKQQLSNARLTAAAPDMLEALQMMQGVFHLMGWENDPAAINARAAIKKALGE